MHMCMQYITLPVELLTVIVYCLPCGKIASRFFGQNLVKSVIFCFMMHVVHKIFSFDYLTLKSTSRMQNPSL